MKEPVTAHMMCMFCPERAWGGRLGSWLVSDDRWAAAGFKPTDVACRKCLAKREVNTTPPDETEMQRKFEQIIGMAVTAKSTDADVTDQRTASDALHAWASENRWDHPKHKQWLCEGCGGRLTELPRKSHARKRRFDTKFCSGKCRTAACRKRNTIDIGSSEPTRMGRASVTRMFSTGADTL